MHAAKKSEVWDQRHTICAILLRSSRSLCDALWFQIRFRSISYLLAMRLSVVRTRRMDIVEL
jgi:hypothetical protein